MELSSSLLKEFAEETNDTEEITSRSTAYGTIVQSGARMYVQLDGSDQLTSIVQGTNVEAGDRVIVTIENHVATVTTNLSVPATGRITETMVEEGMTYGYFDLLEAQFATVGNLEAVYIYTEQISAELGSFEELAANFITADYIYSAFGEFGILVADEISAAVANLDEVYAGYIQAINAEITNLYASVANIDDLTAKVAQIEEAYISYAEVQELLAGYASIEDLNAAYASITLLDASVANITNLLAGNAGVGDLQSIHLTADNAVIEYAVIEEALMGTILADIITSNIIYTDQITIMSEDGGIYIVGNQMQFSNGQIQFYDDNGVCRLQIGQDASGNFTFVLYDETGTGIMIDSEGIHESAVPDGLIVDSMVAEDANIAASKIDMADVISYINDSGDLVLDAYQIYIDGERLDYKLTEITESAVSEVVNYYAIGPSPYEPPFEPGEETVYTDAICGIAICGLTYVGTIGWTTTRLYASGEGEYVWFVQKKIYVDGSYSWTEPTCLTDDYVRTKVSTMTTELEVVQGEISAKIWLTDIEDATNVLGDEITTITDQYAELDITINEISAALGELTTSIGSDFEYFYSAIADITVQIDNISMGVSQNLEYIYGIYDEIEDLESQGIKSRTAYFAISYSPDYYPPYSFSPSVYTAITGLAICGLAVVGNVGYWTTEQPIPEEGQYVWLSYYVEKLDGSTYWETPILLSDEAAREQFTYISSQIAGIQILLDEIDIGIQNVYSYVDDEIEVVNERTAEIVLTLDEIDLGLRNLESIETEHYYYLYDQYTGISMELGNITARVEEAGSAFKSRKAYYALSYSPDYHPTLPELPDPDFSPSIYTAITGLAICGLAIVGNTGYWSAERPDASDGGYIWIAYLVTTIDGDQYWEDPVLLSDDVARSQYAVLSQRYAEIELEINSISLTVYDSGLGTAYIGLSVGDETSEVEVVTKAREAFANSSSSIIIAAGTITFYDGTLVIEGGNFSLDADGNAVFGGTLTSPGGTIGGFTIGSDSIYTISDDFNSVSDNIYIGGSGISLGTAFSVDENGSCYASDLTVRNQLYMCDDNNPDTKLLAFTATTTRESQSVICEMIVGSGADKLYVGAASGSIWMNTDVFVGHGSNLILYTDGQISSFCGTKDPVIACTSNYSNHAARIRITQAWSGNSISLHIGSGGTNRGIYDDYEGRWIIYYDDEDVVVPTSLYASGTFTVKSTSYLQGAVHVGPGSKVYVGSDSSSDAEALRVYNKYNAVSLYINQTASGSGSHGLYDQTVSCWMIRATYNHVIYLGNGTYNTYLNGKNVYLNDGTAVTSDRKMKSEIQLLDINHDDLLDLLIPRSYVLNNKPDEIHFGFIVDEVEEAMKECGFNPNDYGLTEHYHDDDQDEEFGAIRYDEFIPMLVHEIQELKTEVAKLKASA